MGRAEAHADKASSQRSGPEMSPTGRMAGLDVKCRAIHAFHTFFDRFWTGQKMSRGGDK